VPELPPAPLDATQPPSRSVEVTSADTPSSDGAAPGPAFERPVTAEVEPGTDQSLEPTESGSVETPALAAAQVEPAATALNEPVASATAGPEPVASLVGAGEASELACRAQGPSGDAAESAPSSDMASKMQPAGEEFIEVWRPGRRDEHARKPHHERRARPRRPQRETQAPPLATAAPAGSAESVSAPAAPAVPAGQEVRADRPRPERRREADRPERRSPRPKRAEHPQRDGDRASRGDRAGRAPRGDRPDRDPALRAKYIKGRAEGAERREPDPNSPFAKLAALKEQLEASNKEPR